MLAYDGVQFFDGYVIASAETFGDSVNWRNVIEAYSATFDTAAWVVLLEVEVFLQLKDKLINAMMAISRYLKVFLYTILFVCAAYWGLKSSFLDFWDVFLWLVAFILIELNLFQWHSETEEEKAREAVV